MKSGIFGWLFRNIQYKLSALVLAILFWYIVQGEEVLEINRRIAVTIKAPDGLMIKGPEVRYKDATLRGPRAFLADFSTRPLEAPIVIQSGKVGQLRYRIDKEYLKNFDNRISLTVHDPYLTIFVDEKVSKKVQVKEYLKGVPADGFIIEKSVLKPSTVTITGLKSEVSKIDEIQTDPIDVSQLDASKTFEAHLNVKESPESILSTDKVQVSISLGEKKVNKRFGSVPVEVVGSDFLTAVKPRYVSIVIQGTPGVLGAVKRSDLEAFIEARDLDAGKRHVRPIQVKIPPETVLIETFPPTATVEIYNQKRLK